MPIPLLATCAAILLSGVLLGGCGGGDSEGSDDAAEISPPSSTQRDDRRTLSRAQMIEQGDKACSEFRDKAGVALKNVDNVGPEEQATLIRRATDYSEEHVERIEALQPPPGDQQIIDRYLAKSREGIVLLRRAAEALEDGDTAEANTLLESGPEAEGELRGIAQGYGFKICGSKKD